LIDVLKSGVLEELTGAKSEEKAGRLKKYYAL
jgi:hypothetical protein